MLLGVGHQHVLGLLVVGQHHEVVLTADAGLLVAAKRAVRWVDVVVVDPHAARLNLAARAVAGVLVARPDTGAEAEVCVICNLDGFLEGLERSHREHRAEDFFTEDAHVVGALEHGWLDVVAVLEAFDLVHVAADEGLRALLRADFQVLGNLFHLFLGGLRAHHGLGVERVADLDLLDALDSQLEELVRDVFVDERTRWAGTHLALVERKHNEAFDTLLEVGVILVHDVREEDGRGLAAQLEGDGDDLVSCGLVDDLAHWGGAGERNLGNAIGAGQGRSGLLTNAVDNVEHALGEKVTDDIDEQKNGRRGLLGWLHDDGIAGGQGRRDLPSGHEQREVPRNDLPHDAKRLVEVISHGVLVDLRKAAFLRTNGTAK